MIPPSVQAAANVGASRQMEMVSRTLSLLEQRVALNEDRIARMADAQQLLLQRLGGTEEAEEDTVAGAEGSEEDDVGY